MRQAGYGKLTEMESDNVEIWNIENTPKRQEVLLPFSFSFSLSPLYSCSFNDKMLELMKIKDAKSLDP